MYRRGLEIDEVVYGPLDARTAHERSRSRSF